MQNIINETQGSSSTLVVRGFLLFIFIFTALLANAQPPDNIDPNAPIDGGLSLLVAAGVGFGAKKLKERRHK